MGEAFITRRGGTTSFFAVIAVTYPVGSVCTCTNGTETLTAKDTSGTFLFLIPSAGTWTVWISDAEHPLTADSPHKSVNITTQYQSESATLDYAFYLFKSGEGAISGYYTAYQTYSNVIIGTESIGVSYGSAVSNGTVFRSGSLINITGYNTLSIDIKIDSFPSGSASFSVGLSTIPFAPANDLAGLNGAKVRAYVGARSTVSLDLTGISGSYYVGWFGSGNATVYNFWLE